MNALALPLVVALLGVVGEILINRYVQHRTVSWHDTIFNLNSGHILMWLFRGIEVFCFGYVSAHLSFDVISSWPVWLQWTFAFFAWDFCFYWLHRLHHEIPVLWAVHVVHHQGEHFNLSLGVRNSWYSSITSIPFFLGLAVLGLPLYIFIAVSSFHYSVQLFNHNSFVKNLGWLERILITPAHHRIHHGANPEYVDTNYGGTLVCWDKLFGTFQKKLEGQETIYGVPGMQMSCNPFWASNLPFMQLFKWQIPQVKIHSRWQASALRVALGGIILFGLVIYYVHHEGHWPGALQSLYFALIFMGTICLGGMSDGRLWSWCVWGAICLALPSLYFASGVLNDGMGSILMCLLLVHGLFVVPGLARRAVHST